MDEISRKGRNRKLEREKKEEIERKKKKTYLSQ